MKIETFLDKIDGLTEDNGMFINTLYHYPNPDHDWKDMLEIVIKDLDTGEKYVESIENPEMVVFFALEGHEPEIQQEYLDMNKAIAVPVSYNNREMDIAKYLGDSYAKQAYENIRAKNRRANREIHKHPNVYGSDFDINAWTKIHWVLGFENDRPKPITKQYLDIEADVVGLERFVLPGERPINAVTLIDEESMTSLTFLLRNEKNPQIKEFEDNVDAFVDELHEEFDETYGVFDYKIFMYDEVDEINLIHDLFKAINSMKRDFVMIWNMDFDIPYILKRIEALGHDPAEIVTHPDFERARAYYSMNPNIFEAADRSSRFDVSSYSVFLDQMVVYAGLRKGQGTMTTTALTYIAETEIGDEKLDYGEVTNFGDFPYENYSLFVKYNIKDVLLQLGIERKTRDIDKLYRRVTSNATPYDKAFKQTRFIENRGYIEYFLSKRIIGNNTNLNYLVPYGSSKEEDEDSSYDGGLVADPTLNGPHGMVLYGTNSKHAHSDVVDYDHKSMYPTIYISHNISKTTMIGKVTIDGYDDGYEGIHELEELSDVEVDNGTQFMDDYTTKNITMIGERWLGLPNFNDVLKRVKEELRKDDK